MLLAGAGSCGHSKARRPEGGRQAFRLPIGHAIISRSCQCHAQEHKCAPSSCSSVEASDLQHPQWQQRTALLLGAQSLAKLHSARVLVVGLGGVGSFAAELLARAGVGSLTIVDGDVVDLSNTNRQLPATHSTVGMSKVSVMAARLKDIAPSLVLNAREEFILPETADELLAQGAMGQDGCVNGFDWVVDAIDSLEPKKLLIRSARAAGISIISSMGAGGRLDPSQVKVVPLSSTFNDPFAMNIRKNLRRKGVDLGQVPCVWSEEPVNPRSLQLSTVITKFKRSYHGTISYLPAQFGLLAAAHVINSLVDGPMVASYRAISTETWGSKVKRQVAERRAQKQRDLLAQAEKQRAEGKAGDSKQRKANVPSRDQKHQGALVQAADVHRQEEHVSRDLQPAGVPLPSVTAKKLCDHVAPPASRLGSSVCEPDIVVSGGGQASFLNWAVKAGGFADSGADI